MMEYKLMKGTTMKKNIFILLSILALALSACSAASSTQTSAATATTNISAEVQVLMGTFKLEGTILAVTPEQAVELLPLWQVYEELSTSDTAAQAEVDALVEQIHDTMTADQLTAIDEMQLTTADMFTVMQENGIGMGVVSQASSGSSSSSTSSGGMPGGDGAPPDMGGMPSGSPDMSGGQPVAQTSSQTTDPASQPSVSMGTGQIPSTLIEALIQLLETRSVA
jgi:hypothetical protein